MLEQGWRQEYSDGGLNLPTRGLNIVSGYYKCHIPYQVINVPPSPDAKALVLNLGSIKPQGFSESVPGVCVHFMFHQGCV